MSLKVNLLEWVVKTFGENDTIDVSNIREDIAATKDPKINIKKIVVFVKKRIGINKDWTKKEITDVWEIELKDIIGDHLKFSLSSTEGREICYTSGVKADSDGTEHYIKAPGTDAYNYQFNLEIVKRCDVKEKSHVSVKPRTPKGQKKSS